MEAYLTYLCVILAIATCRHANATVDAGDKIAARRSSSPLPAVTVTVGTDVVARSEPELVSYTIDAAIFCQGNGLQKYLKDPVVRARVRDLAPLVIRLGGTSEDFSQYSAGKRLPALPGVPQGCNQSASALAAISSFANDTGARIIFGLNGLLRDGAQPSGHWAADNAAALLRDDAARVRTQQLPSMFGYELGNEPHLWQMAGYGKNISAAAHAADWQRLRSLVSREYDGVAALAAVPRLVGPDVWVPCLVHGEPGGPAHRGDAPICDADYLRAFLAAKPDLDIVTFHLYPAIGSYGPWYKPTAADLYSTDFLDIASAAAGKVVQAVRALGRPNGKQLPIWMGEGSPDWRINGKLKANLTFELFSTDMTASLARAGVGLYARQCLNSAISSSGAVSPAFWSALLWKQLMAEEVFDATSSSQDLREFTPPSAQFELSVGFGRTSEPVRGTVFLTPWRIAGAYAGTYAHAARAQPRLAGEETSVNSPDLVSVLLINRGSVSRNTTVSFENTSLSMQDVDGLQARECKVQHEWHVTAGPDVMIGGVTYAGILINGQQPALKASQTPGAFKPRRAPCGTPVMVAPHSWSFVLRSR